MKRRGGPWISLSEYGSIPSTSNSERTCREGLTGSLEAAGQARYALADFGGGRPLAVIADVTATNEDLQFGSGPWGTLYVGATVDGSLADPVARPFLECCAEVELTFSYEYKGEQAQLPVRVYARIDRQYHPWSADERARLQAMEDRGDWDAVNAMYDEREVNGFEVYAEFWNEGLRAGEIPRTGELFLLQPALSCHTVRPTSLCAGPSGSGSERAL